MWINRDYHHTKNLKAVEDFVQVFPDTENAAYISSMIGNWRI